MYRIINISRIPSLLYDNLLTCIFTHFKVPLDLEDYVTQPVPVISAESLKTLQFYKIETRGWQHVSDFTLEEASALKVVLPNPTSSPNIADTLVALKEDHVELRTQLDHLQMEMGLMNRKIDALIRLTSLIHHDVKLAVPFQSTNLEKVAQSFDQIIHSTSSMPHFC